MESMEIVNEKGEIMSLSEQYKGIPLDGLNISSRRKLAKYLNIPAEFHEDSGHIGDYTGLAELIGFDYLDIKNFERQKSPTEEVLEAWSQRAEFQPTIGNLWKYLIELGRLDVLEDCEQNIRRDIEGFLQRRAKFQDEYIPIQEDEVSQSTETAPDHHVDETLVLSKDDAEGCPQFYDAFVCYNPEGSDVKFVKEMIKMLENKYKLKLFVPYRDDLPGGARYVMDAKLIESRCRRMVIIMSQNYMKSSACDFQVKFAHALSPGARSKKLIPVLIESSVKIPQILRHVTLCDFTKQDLMEWFWDRLAKAIQAPLEPEKSVDSLDSPNSSASSSMDIENSSSMSESINIEFPVMDHQEVRSELESLDSSSLEYSSSQGSSTGFDPDSGFCSSSSSLNVGSTTDMLYQRDKKEDARQKKSIMSGVQHFFFPKKKKHKSQHTSSHA